MFEVRIMVEDSKLHKALWALDGLIVGQPQLLPVRNAVASKDKNQVKEKGKAPHGSLISTLRTAITDGSIKPITWKGIADLMETLGSTRPAASGYIKRFEGEGLLKKVSKGTYIVRE